MRAKLLLYIMLVQVEGSFQSQPSKVKSFIFGCTTVYYSFKPVYINVNICP